MRTIRGLAVPAVAMALVGLLTACGTNDPYFGMTGDQLWAEGSAAYEEEDWDTAILTLQRLTAQAPGHSRVPEARIYLARAHEAKGEFLTAAAEYNRFLQVNYNHELAPQASLGECRAFAELAPIPERDQAPTRTALDSCRRSAGEFPGTPEADRAREFTTDLTNLLAESHFLQGASYRRIRHETGAIDYWEDLLVGYPETRWAPRALLEIYRAYRRLGWEEEADETVDRLLFNFPDSPAADELRRAIERSGRGGGV